MHGRVFRRALVGVAIIGLVEFSQVLREIWDPDHVAFLVIASVYFFAPLFWWSRQYLKARRHFTRLTSLPLHPRAPRNSGLLSSSLSFYGAGEYSILEISSVRIAYAARPTTFEAHGRIPVSETDPVGGRRVETFDNEFFAYQLQGGVGEGRIYSVPFQVCEGVLAIGDRKVRCDKAQVVVLSKHGEVVTVIRGTTEKPLPAG